MLPVLAEVHANPASPHWAGRRAHELVELARAQVAALAHTGPAGVVFLSGATEANTLALRGILGAATGSRRGVVSCVTEHPSVLVTLHQMAAEGVPVRLVGV